MKAKEIVKTALSFVGQSEIKGNQGFTDPKFLQIMESVGWEIGQAWCSYFAEAVLKLAYKGNDKTLAILDKLCSASAVKTLENFSKAGYKVSDKATPGAIVIYQTIRKGRKAWTGHAGIVTAVYKDYFETVEGNTGSNGVREGEVVATRKRKYSFNVYNGLELQGFIWPIDDQGADVETKETETAQPFSNTKEGNKFRRWVNDQYPEIASELDLDRSGKYNNSYILKAYARLNELYTA